MTTESTKPTCQCECAAKKPRRRRRLLRVPQIAAVVLGLLMVTATVVVASHSFPDVSSGHPFHDEIGWMKDTGISTGFGDGTYRPSEPVTRQAMSAFMFRLATNGVVVPEDESVTGAKIADDAVGSNQLGIVRQRVTTQVMAGAAGFAVVSASCLAGEQLIGGGGWTNQDLSLHITRSSPNTVTNGAEVSNTWTVVWQRDSGASDATVRAYAICLTV